MPVPDDPATMAPAERLAELSTILARGILRLHSRGALPVEDSRDSSRNELDSGRETSPHVPVVRA